MGDSKRRSVKLEKWERKALDNLRQKFSTAIECAEFLGLKRNTFDRIYLVGSGSADTVDKVRAKI